MIAQIEYLQVEQEVILDDIIEVTITINPLPAAIITLRA